MKPCFVAFGIQSFVFLTKSFPVLLVCACETWSVVLRAQYMLGFFKNRELRMIFGPQTKEVAGGWENSILMNFVILYRTKIIIWVIK